MVIVVLVLGAVVAICGLGWGQEKPAAEQKLPTMDEVLVKMKAKWDVVKSYEIDMKGTIVEGKEEPGGTFSMHWAAERQEKGGKTMERSEMVMKATRQRGLGIMDTRELRMVNDGKYVWEEDRTNHEKIEVKKNDASSPAVSWQMQWGPKFMEFGGPMSLSVTKGMMVLGEETIDGKKMYVLEKNQGPEGEEGTAWKRRVWIGEEDLCIWRSSFTMSDNSGMLRSMTSEILNVRLNEKVDEGHFKYAVPDGAALKDKTKGEPK